jgi:hypothetical protein
METAKTLIMMLVVGSLFLGGCFTNDPVVRDERPPQMNNTPFTNFVPSNTTR